MLEQLGYHHDDLGVFISVISGCGLALPILGASPEHQLGAERMRRTQRGKEVIAVAITEPTAGSDVLAMQSKLTHSGCNTVLNGSKWNISNAPLADYAIVFWRDERGPTRQFQALLLPCDAPGVGRAQSQSLIGCHGSPTGQLTFTDVVVEPDWLLPSDGKTLLDLAFARERTLAPWPLLGKMANCIQRAVDYVSQRRQFSRPIASYQYVQDRIVSCYEKLATARALATSALASVMASRPSQAAISLAKYHATEAGVEVFRTLIGVYGSYGLQASSPLAGYLNDALCATVAGGTREMHKRVVFDQIMLDAARSRRRGRSALFAVTSARGRQRDGESF